MYYLYMLNILFVVFSGLGFIILLNNNIIFNMNEKFKQSLSETILENPSIMNNQIVWYSYKLYATSKNKLVTFYNDWQRNIYKKNLRSNILLVCNGKRTQTILCKNNSNGLTGNDILKYKDEQADLILYRTPSQEKEIDYDLIRLDNLQSITFSENKKEENNGTNTNGHDEEKNTHDNTHDNTHENTCCNNDANTSPDVVNINEISSDANNNNVNLHKDHLSETDNPTHDDVKDILKSCNTSYISIDYDKSHHTIYTPTLVMENSDTTYDLSLEKDNYYITNNILFDTAFVAWILAEKYNITLDSDENYRITYFDSDMNEKTINKDESIKLNADKIQVIDNSKKNDPVETKGWIW